MADRTAFLRDAGEVFALFPDIPAGDGYVTVYSHVGQHGAAVLKNLRDSCPLVLWGSPEALALRTELRNVGYDPIPHPGFYSG